MSFTIILIFDAVKILAFLSGLITNGFVLGVNIWDRKHSISLTKSDFYMCYLAITNLSLQIWATATWICNLVQDEDFFCRLMNALKMTSSTCSLLLTASMCMFYCSKIVVFKYCLFQWVQKKAIQHYQYLIIVSVLLCVVMGLPLAWTINDYTNTLCTSLPTPCNKTINPNSYIILYRSVIMFFGYAVPLFYIVLAAGLILQSLLNHMRRMHTSMKMGHEIRMEAHRQASYTILSLLVLFSVYFVLSTLLLTEMVPGDSILFYICYSAPLMYSNVHGLIMIKGNVKLRNAAGGLVKKLKIYNVITYRY